MNSNLLSAQDERAVRTATLVGLGQLNDRLKRPTFTYLEVVHQIAKQFFSGVEARNAGNAWANNQVAFDEGPSSKSEQSDNTKLLAGLWGLIGEGFVFPRLGTFRDGHPHIIESLVLTARGQRMVGGQDEHPLHPGFIARFKMRSPNIGDEVVARLEDAVACLEK